jgi:sulfatase maturation enzyme AslB (radical SAM superfamily)
VEDIEPYLEEIAELNLPTRLIGLTGGEPFLNPNIMDIINRTLDLGFEVLVLTNAYRIIQRHREALLDVRRRYGDRIQIRVSLDHYTPEVHDKERGEGTFNRTLLQIKWLYENGFNVSIASRSLKDESKKQSLEGHKNLLDSHNISLDLQNKIVIFPEMQSGRDVPEITTRCWELLDVKPEAQMCASERMIVKRKGESQPVVMPCTLIAYEEKFVLGKTLKESGKEVYLNHRFCSEFCVLGGASCSSTK